MKPKESTINFGLSSKDALKKQVTHYEKYTMASKKSNAHLSTMPIKQEDLEESSESSLEGTSKRRKGQGKQASKQANHHLPKKSTSALLS